MAWHGLICTFWLSSYAVKSCPILPKDLFLISFNFVCLVLSAEAFSHLGVIVSVFRNGDVHKRRHQSRGEGGLPKDDLT